MMILNIWSLINFEHLLTLHQSILGVQAKIESIPFMSSIYKNLTCLFY